MTTVDAAVRGAADAFAVLRRTTGAQRGALLEAIAAGLEQLGEPLLACAQGETRLPLRPRLEGERARTCKQLHLFAALARDGHWVDARLDPGPPDIRSRLEPLGPVAVFDASNFPLAFGACGGDMAAALAAGCPVVLKSHPVHPRTNRMVGDVVACALRAAALPAAGFTIVEGDAATGGELVRHPALAAVAFTGSLRAGRALMDLAAARSRPIPVFAEMGSLNPLVVLPGAQSPEVAEALSASIVMGAGQFCTKPGLVIVRCGPDTEAFVATLADRLAAAQPHAMLSDTVAANFARTTDAWRGLPGVTSRGRLFDMGASTWLAQPVLHEEAFGPAAVLVRCADLASVEAVLAAVQGSLTGTLHTGPGDDPVAVARLRDALAAVAGRVIFNGYPTGVEVCHAMVHGGPYPATSAPHSTSVGTLAIRRFARPVCYQGVPDALLPAELQNANPLNVWRLMQGSLTRGPL